MEKLVEKELKTLEARRETLASDVEAARTDVDTARAGLITGAVKVNIVTSAQSKFTALTEALGALDQTITATRARLDEARSEEQLRAEAARGRACEDRRRVLTAELCALLKNANAHLAEAVSMYFSKIEEWRREGGEGHFRPPAVGPYDSAFSLAINIEARRRERQLSKEASGRATERERQRQRAA
jgi:hypothetical protein